MPSLERELLFLMLPPGLSKWFDIEHFEKTEHYFRIHLLEKNTPPDTGGRKVINTIIKRSTVDDFPVRGVKTELIVGRRYWKLEGVEPLLKRDIEITWSETRLAEDFASFLKGTY